MFLKRKSFLFLIIFLIFLLIPSCKENINAPDISDEEIIGTWVLTKIIASYPTGKQESTPEAENFEITITLNNDKTFQRNQNINGEITNDSGNWSIENAVLNLVTSTDIFAFACRLNENILLASTTVIDPDSGGILPITLEFTRQQ
ncbi:MAG TPA: DUF5004 domain-containing protein [Ignavibacteriaceae bacterium]|nr:DUF5004 domain-containing protein [Ignavibacteriaceae bacterium]